jgi:hypothetical protein
MLSRTLLSVVKHGQVVESSGEEYSLNEPKHETTGKQTAE